MPILTHRESIQMYKLIFLKPFGVRVEATDDINVQDLSFTLIYKLLREHKLVFFRNFKKMEKTEFLKFARDEFGHSIGRKTLNWESGPLMEVKEDANKKNYLFSREKVPFHWDGAFLRTPRYLVFYCAQAPAYTAGGRTYFTNTQRIVRDASEEEKKLWSQISLTYSTEKLAHYGGEFTEKLLQDEPELGEEPILRFAEPVQTRLNPVTVTIHGGDESFIKNLSQKIYEDRYCYKHVWETHDLLLADNFSLIHAREAFEKDSSRTLLRVQLI